MKSIFCIYCHKSLPSQGGHSQTIRVHYCFDCNTSFHTDNGTTYMITFIWALNNSYRIYIYPKLSYYYINLGLNMVHYDNKLEWFSPRIVPHIVTRLDSLTSFL